MEECTLTTSEKQRQQQAELQKKLWSIANDLRGNMDANEFKITYSDSSSTVS